MKAQVLILLFVVSATGMSQVNETVARVAQTQALLPWFWSPPLEGFYEIPYTFESSNIYRVQDSHGQDRRQPLTLRLERIAALGGIFNRCLEQNGASPCSPEMLGVYKEVNDKGGAFPPGQKATVREHRRDFRNESLRRSASRPSAPTVSASAPRESTSPELVRRRRCSPTFEARYGMTFSHTRLLLSSTRS